MATSIFSIVHAIIAKLKERALRYLRYVTISYICDYSNLIGHIHIPFCATVRVQQWPDPRAGDVIHPALGRGAVWSTRLSCGFGFLPMVTTGRPLPST